MKPAIFYMILVFSITVLSSPPKKAAPAPVLNITNTTVPENVTEPVAVNASIVIPEKKVILKQPVSNS